MANLPTDLVAELREAVTSGKGNYGHRLLCGKSADAIEEMQKRIEFAADGLTVVERRRDELKAEVQRLRAVFEEACNEVRMSHGTPCYCKYCRDPGVANNV